jgi:hypothetical protein
MDDVGKTDEAHTQELGEVPVLVLVLVPDGAGDPDAEGDVAALLA